MSSPGAGQGPDHDQDACTRCGILAAKVARGAQPGHRKRDDVVKLARLIQSRHSFLAGFSQEVLEDVCQNLEYVPMLAKKTIFAEGTPGKHVYLIATGRVSLTGTHRVSKTCALVAGPDGETTVDIEASGSGSWHQKSRTTSKQRRGMQHGTAEAATTNEVEEASPMQRQISPMQRFRSAVAAMKAESIKTALKEEEEEEARAKELMASKALATKPRRVSTVGKAWHSTLEPGSSTVRMTGRGRLHVPLASVVDTLAQHSSMIVGQATHGVFNNTFQDFNKRVDAKIIEVLPVEKVVEVVPKSSPRASPDIPVGTLANTTSPSKTQEATNSPALDEKVSATEAIGGQAATGPSTWKQRMGMGKPLDASATAGSSEVTVVIAAGYMFGVHACMNETSYDGTARSIERCELLMLSVEKLRRAVEKELGQRRHSRQQTLLSAVPSLRGIDAEKCQRLTESFRTSTHRRGAVLAWEGEVRIQGDEDDRVQFLVKGVARTFKGRSEKADAPPLSSGSSKREHSPVQRDVGTLLPGQVVNGASQFLATAEPLTVTVDSADAIVLSVSYADLARLGGLSVLEGIRTAVQDLHSWREHRLIRLTSSIQQQSAEREKYVSSQHQETEVLSPDDVYEQLSTWYSEEKLGVPVPEYPVMEEDHDGLTRHEFLRGGPPVTGKRTFPVPPPRCGPEIAESMLALARSISPEQEDFAVPDRVKTPGHFGQRHQDSSWATSTSDLRSAQSPRTASTSALIPNNVLSSAETDAILWGSGILNCNAPGHEDGNFLLDNNLPDDHFSRVPNLSPFVSQLDVGEYGMRFPASPRCDRLEMRCAQGHIMESGPINPLHIAALHSERRRGSKSPRSHLSTAPIQRAPRQSESPLFGDMSSSLPKPSTAPLPKTLTPLTARLPHPRRWRTRSSGSSASTDLGLPAVECPLTDSLGLEFSDLDPFSIEEPQTLPQARPQTVGVPGPRLGSGDRLIRPQTVGDPRPRLGTRESMDSSESILTIAPAPRSGPRRSLTEDPLLSNSFDMQASSWDGADASALLGSVDAASDPLTALSLANLSTMADETSVWDQMWSVLGGSFDEPQFSDGPVALGQSVEQLQAHPFAMPWLQKRKPTHKTCGRRGNGNQSLGRTLPGAHQPLRTKARQVEAAAKRSLGEMTPLHVNGIDRFLGIDRSLRKPPSRSK